jgi:ABC-type multidrug transport system permease subunit
MTFVVFAVLVWKVIDFLRMLFNITTQRSAIITQATAWVGGVLLVLIASHAGVMKALVLPGSDQALGLLDFPSQVLIGLLVSSFASGVVDIKKAIDNTDSSAVVPLIPASTTTVVKQTPVA